MEIIKQLLASDKSVTGKQLADKLAVTARTVKNDMDAINHILKTNGAIVNSAHSVGYILKIENESNFRAWLSRNHHIHTEHLKYENSEERVRELIRFLLTMDHYIKSDELAEYMFVSKSTLQNDLKELKKLLEPYNIIIDAKPYYGLKVIGSEMNLRFAISEYLFAHDSKNSIYMDKRIVPIPDSELTTIRNIVIKHTSSHNIELSDVGINDLVIHIAISYNRVLLNHHIDSMPGDIEINEQSAEYQIAQGITKELSDIMKVTFPQSETDYIMLHLMGTKMLSAAKDNDSLLHLNQEVYQYTLDIIKTVDSKLMLGIGEDEELVKGLYLHLKPALNRIRYGMSLRNPMLESIKTRLPLPFQAGVIARTVLKEKTGFEVSDNEIGYLALHIGAAMERRKQIEPIRRCIVVCGSGMGSAQLLYYRLRAQFAGRIEVTETMGYYKLDKADFSNIDFVISTVPIELDIPVPVVIVNPLLGIEELKKIENAICGAPKSDLEFLRKDLVFLSREFDSREDVIRFLCNQLIEKGIAKGNLYDFVLQREKFTSTAYGNLIAIPHPLIPQTEQTVWAVCTLRKPVLWEGKPVQCVIMLCIAEDGSTSDLSAMYNVLVKFTDDSSYVQQIINYGSYDEFYKFIHSNI
ncbi:hypothetical protein P40081_28010 [Paenibacillus sp. FSL P4-0081]|nr:hypothetical protein P40081_28010 [Paenibacillus sp. FSL P4-0081]